jgi:O-antigen/teichoic acid export membrane protein
VRLQDWARRLGALPTTSTDAIFVSFAATNPETFEGKQWAHIARLFPSFGVAQVLQAITGFLIARVLFPNEYGLWSLFAVALFYSAQLHLGSINLMHKEVPFFLAGTDRAAAQQVTNFAFTLSLTNCVFAAVLICAAALLWRPASISLLQLLLLALLVISQELFIFVNYLLRAYQRFSALSAYLNLYACSNLALVAGLGWWKHLTGALLGYVITSTGVALYFIFRQHIGVAYRLQMPDWKSLGRAFQLLLWTMMFVFLTTLDRVFISSRLGMLALGLFGVSLLLSNLVYNTTDVVLQVLFPTASALAGSNQSPQRIAHLLLNSARALSYLLAVVLGLGFLLLPAAVPLLLPRYTLGIPAARIVCLGLAPLVLAQLLSVSPVVSGKLRLCLLLQAAVLVVKAISLFGLRNLQLADVALVSSLANVLYLLAMLAIIPASIGEKYWSFASVAAPWILVGTILLIADMLEGTAGFSGLHTLLPSSVYLLLAPPSLWLMYRRTSGVLHV